jgi:hypothetical protein
LDVLVAVTVTGQVVKVLSPVCEQAKWKKQSRIKPPSRSTKDLCADVPARLSHCGWLVNEARKIMALSFCFQCGEVLFPAINNGLVFGLG